MKSVRLRLVFYLYIGFSANIVSQSFTYCDSTSIAPFNNTETTIGKINVDQCDESLLTEFLSANFTFDILVRQDGKVFGYGVPQFSVDKVLYEMRPTGFLILLPDALLVDEKIKGLTCDENGYLYAAGKGITKQSTDFLSLNEEYLGDLPVNMECQGDMTYRKGKFYLHSISNQLVEVNMKDPSKSKVVMDFPSNTLPIDGLVTVQLDCENTITYAIGRSATNSKVYEIDFNNWTLTELCDIPLSITGAGDSTECMLPPCDVFLDLDSDNSSLGFRGNFCADTACIPPMSVADTDIIITSSSGTIDSVTLELFGEHNIGQEYLSTGITNSLIANGNNSIMLTLQNNGSATFADFENAIESVQYFNDAASITYGIREVHITAFSAGESSPVSIAELPLFSETLATQADVIYPTCNGSMDGSINLVTYGGVLPYNYLWETGEVVHFIESLSAGTYPYTVTDAGGCTKLDTVVLKEPDILTVDIIYTGHPAICNNSGQLKAVAVGGSEPLSYAWSYVGDSSINNNVGPGNYSLTVQDSSGCTAIADFDIPAGDTVLIVQNESICEGVGFSWNGDIYFDDTTACQVFTTIGGCDSIVCLSLTVGPSPMPSIFVSGSFCDQDEITLSIGSYENYIWSNNEDFPEITISNAGDYGVTVTNDFGCTGVSNITINKALSFDLISVKPSCVGEQDGFIVVDNAIGGTPPFRYSIDGGSKFYTNGRFEGLSPGNYLLVVEDTVGCQVEMEVLLEAPVPITLDVGPDQEIMLGNTVVLNATTNLADPLISWQPPNYLDCNYCLSTTARPLATIEYEVEVIDSNGCSMVDSLLIAVIQQTSGIYVPTAFSPNDDGINDTFTIYADSSILEIRYLKVYDRWGGLAFENQDFIPNVVAEGWDGRVGNKFAPVGIYIFIAEVKLVNGYFELISGEVTLIR